MEQHAKVETSGFIDDTSTRKTGTQEEIVQSMNSSVGISFDFRQMTGVTLNFKKVKILANAKSLEEALIKEIDFVEEKHFKKAIILVGGIISSGSDDKPTKTARYNLKQKRGEKANHAIEHITRAGIGFEGSSRLMETYFAPANVYGSCLQLYTTAARKNSKKD